MELFAKRVTGFQTWFWFDNSSKPLYPANGNTCKTGITWILIKCYHNLRQKTSNFMKLYIYIKCGERTTTKNVSLIAMHVKLLYQTVILYFVPSEAFNVALSILSLCLKSSHIRSFSGPYFPTFGLNTEIYSVNREYCGYGHLPHSFYTILSILFLYVIWYNKISLSQQYNTQIMPKVFTTPCWNSWTSPRSVFRTLANV